MGDEDVYPVAGVQNPFVAAATQQGKWNSCAVFALTTTLASKLKSEFRMEIDAQNTADGLLTRGLKNRKGTLIIDDGVDIPWLVDLLNQEEQLMVKTGEHSWAKLSISICALRNVNEDGRIERGFPGTYGGDALVLAGGLKGKGPHTNHALHATKIEYEPKLTVQCENSWGDVLENVVVPGEWWKKIVQFYRIYFEKLEVKCGDEWVEAFAGGFLCGTQLVATRDVKGTCDQWLDCEMPQGTKVTVVSKPSKWKTQIRNDKILYIQVPDGRIAYTHDWVSFSNDES